MTMITDAMMNIDVITTIDGGTTTVAAIATARTIITDATMTTIGMMTTIVMTTAVDDLSPTPVSVTPGEAKESPDKRIVGFRTYATAMSVTRTREASESETSDSEIRIPDRSQIREDR